MSAKIVHSCDFEQLFNLRSQINEELKQPKESLLLFRNNSIGFISSNPSIKKIHKTTGTNVNIYQLRLNEKILKKYEEALDEIFFQISKCEKKELNIDDILNFPVSRVPFGRLN